jgi:hypothetical protein
VSAKMRGRWQEVLGEDFYPESDTQRAVEAVRGMFNEYPLEAEGMLRQFIEESSYPRLFTAAALLFYAFARYSGPAPSWLLHSAGVSILEQDEKVAEKERKARARDEKHQVRWMAVCILMYGPPRRRERALRVLQDAYGAVPTWVDGAQGNVYSLVSELLVGHPAASAPSGVRASYLNVKKSYQNEDLRALATAAIRELL